MSYVCMGLNGHPHWEKQKKKKNENRTNKNGGDLDVC